MLVPEFPIKLVGAREIEGGQADTSLGIDFKFRKARKRGSSDPIAISREKRGRSETGILISYESIFHHATQMLFFFLS